MPKRKIDWKALEDEYVTGPVSLSLDGLAEKHGLAAGNLRSKAAALKWTEKRERFRDEVQAEAAKLSKKTEVKRRARMLTIADSMKALGSSALARLIKDFEADGKKRLSIEDLRLLIKDATEIERKALGMADAVIMTDREIEDRILKLMEDGDEG